MLNSDGTVEARSVDVGLIASDYAQITGGLAEGEAIVTGSSADRTSTSSSTTTNDRGGFRGLDGGGIQVPAGGFQPPAGAFPGQP